MKFIKKIPEIHQLDLHLNNLSTEVNKIIVQHTQTNAKMYSYNFQKVAIKFHKLTLNFIDHLTVKEKMYDLLEKIKAIARSLNQASKDHKARSSRAYRDDESFVKLSSTSQFFNSLISETDLQDQKQIDEIQQFMMRRNHQLQSNIFGDTDQSFKNRERNALQQFLNHTDIHAKSLQAQLKNSSHQRNEMSKSFRIDSLSKNKFLFQKATFDMGRINELNHRNLNQGLSNQTINQNSQLEQKSIQTIFTGQNIKWDKIMTYCVNRPTKINDETQTHQSQTLMFNPQIFGRWEVNLVDFQVQTNSDLSADNNQKSKVIAKKQIKKQVQKKSKTAANKGGNNQKRTKTKQKQSKADSVMIKAEQKQQIQIEDSALASNQFQKKPRNLQIQSFTFNQCFHCEAPKIATHTTFQAISGPSKKSMKVLQTKQLVFEFTSRKQLNQKAGIQFVRNQKKNKSICINLANTVNLCQNNNENRSTYKEFQARDTIVRIEEDQKSYQTTINIEQGLVRRKIQKKNTWKGSINSSHAILKSSSRLNHLKTEQSIQCNQNLFEKNHSVNQDSQKNSQHHQEKDKKDTSKKIQRRTYNFKQMYVNTTKQAQLKPIFNKRNTLDTMICTNEFQNQIAHFTAQNGTNDQYFQKLIEKQEFSVSYRNTEAQIQIDQKGQNGKIRQQQNYQTSKRTDKRQTKRSKQRQTISPDLSHINQNKQNIKNIAQRQPKYSLNLKQNFRINTIDKDSQVRSRRFQAQRNSSTTHESNNLHRIFVKKQQKHLKHCSQQLPDLSNCKQKLSDIKNIIENQIIAKKVSSGTILTSLLKQQKLKTSKQRSRQQYVKVFQQEQGSGQDPALGKRMNQFTSQYKPYSMTSFNQSPRAEQEKITLTLRRLFMTKSYRDKLMLYMSMIEVTHQKYCGKGCQHIQKFINDMTGGIESTKQSVGQQLLKMYNTKNHNFDISVK